MGQKFKSVAVLIDPCFAVSYELCFTTWSIICVIAL